MGAYPDKAVGQRMDDRNDIDARIATVHPRMPNNWFSFLFSSVSASIREVRSRSCLAKDCSSCVCGLFMITNCFTSGMVRTYALSTASTMTLI